MSEIRTLLERKRTELHAPAGSFERLILRRERKRRNQRVTAGVVGIAVFVGAIWIVTSGLSLDRSGTSVVPGGDVTGPTETAPPRLVEPVPIGTVTQSGAGCALELGAGPIPAGPGRLTVVNETNRRVSFELFRLVSDASFAQFKAFVEASPARHDFPEGTTSGALIRRGWFEREVKPGASGTITDNVTTGDAFAVVCLEEHYFPGTKFPGHWGYVPFAVVGPIVVP